MRDAGALRVGDDVQAVGDALDGLLSDPAARAGMATAGRRLVEQGRGALARTLELVRPALPAERAD
jgi:3-deoxy-D-manno-octulosonic-acid transferase